MRRALCGVLLLAACPSAPRKWTLLGDGLDRVPLCAWGPARGDVWLGGGGVGAGPGALLLHWDGHELAEVATGRAETIWWVHGTSAKDVWAVGERGLALHAAGGAFSPVATGTTATLYGVWAASPTDAWVAGGSPAGNGPNDVLLHWDGAAWSAAQLPDAVGAAYFKVWGRAKDDVFVVGQGTALHWDGRAWTRTPVPTKTALFTVHGGGRGVFAIGGPPPVLLSWDGKAWGPVALPPEASSIMSGVFVTDDAVFLTGERGQRYRWDGKTFADDTETPPTTADLHAVFMGSDGDGFAVGGNYLNPVPSLRGTVLRWAP